MRRVEAALRLGALAIEERNFPPAEDVMDEVRDLAGDRRARLEEVGRARQEKVR